MNTYVIDHAVWARPLHADSTSVVILLHGRGADEQSMLGLAAHLPPESAVVALRAPIDLGAGYAWFANRGIGRPIAESISAVSDAVHAWVDAEVPESLPVVLLGFSGGAAMVGGLVLGDPMRFAASVHLSGTLPWDAGYDMSEGRLAGFPLFWGSDPADQVIPRELMDRSEQWLHTVSGADLTVREYPGLGHQMSSGELADVSAFITAAQARLR